MTAQPAGTQRVAPTPIRQWTPFVLLVVGLGILFEPWVEPLLPFHETLRKQLGDNWVLRGCAAVLVFQVLLLWSECARLHASLVSVLKPLRDLHAMKQAAEGRSGTRLDALRVLVAALQSGDPKVRTTSRENLVRIAGKDLGDDPGKWNEWLREQERAAGE